MPRAVGSTPRHLRVAETQIQRNGQVYYTCQLFAPPNGPCYGPDQIRAAYGIQPLLDAGYTGAGKTIAIIDAYGSPTLADDLAYFDTRWNLPAANLTVVTPFGVAPTDPANASGWSGETTLDVEWAHAVAPGAAILLIVAKSNQDSDILDATQWLADHNNADVLSQSYGEGEACMAPADLARQHKLFEQLTKQKITIFASAGDDGAAQPTCDGSGAVYKAASSPASDPDVTGVGGTALVADGTTGAYGSESVWNETDILGGLAEGGSGISVIYSRPDFQAPIVKDTKMRVVPDISYNAAVLEGVLTRWNGGTYRFGGTSAGSPQWAALIAIADQMAGGRIGPINKTLYLLGKKSQSTYYHDVATGDNSIEDFGPGTGTPITGFQAGSGFDEATGWGTPIANILVPAIAKPGNG
jgi:subtilase family serine protease